ncbi:transposase [Patescibacteria group bacterium]|nr:transposase [Patescibacteria group bacterium]
MIYGRGLAPVNTGAKPLRNLVEYICYCLNSNHFHLILKQSEKRGISEFMKHLAGVYTTFFNQKYKRSGSLFQGSFKAIHIETNEYLLWLSGYINGNIKIHRKDQAENYKWSSYLDYLGKRIGTLCDKKIIFSQFENASVYHEFVNMTIKELEIEKI